MPISLYLLIVEALKFVLDKKSETDNLALG